MSVAEVQNYYISSDSNIADYSLDVMNLMTASFVLKDCILVLKCGFSRGCGTGVTSRIYLNAADRV